MTPTTLTMIGVGMVILILVPLAGTLKSVIPDMILHSSGVDEIEVGLYALQSEAHNQQRAVQVAIADRNRLFSEVGRLKNEIRRLDKLRTEAEAARPEFVHELGEPQPALLRFVARLERESQSTSGNTVGERLEPNPLWYHDNLLEVWAKSYDDARQLAETAYPIKLGYLKQFFSIPATTAASRGRPPSPGRLPRRAQAAAP